jgi:hypothetical protein
MDAPKPSAHWGRWRFQPVRVTGRTIIPAALTSEDRAEIRERRELSRVRKSNEGGKVTESPATAG